ncbi:MULTISPECIES: FCD domain-containing protein [Streptomyces]|uniref:FCD domain-containing protein n=1 Tax=Streptomyces TaxID=1883 RepID=UPI001EF64325|nr:FCD domain-containing protein [Streptomyces sp. CS081A]
MFVVGGGVRSAVVVGCRSCSRSWPTSLHAAIAAIGPNALLSSPYTHLLDLIESHTLTVLPTGEQPLGEYVAHRHELHRDLVDALDRRDRDEALRLIREHDTGLQDTGGPAAER